MNTKFSEFPHQTLIREYFSNSPHHGIILYHGLGTGKTCTSIISAAAAANNGEGSPPRKTFVFLPAALVQNYTRELEKCGSKDHPPQFIHYNGLQHKRVGSMRSEDYDGSVIVIDEVHNFASRASTQGSVLNKLYHVLMNAKDTRFILLSGTPVLNYVSELAYIVNIAKGAQTEYLFAVADPASAAAVVEREKRVQDATVEPGALRVTLCPSGFAFEGDNLVPSKDRRPEAEVVLALREALRTSGTPVRSVESRSHEALPTNKDDFNRIFLTMDGDLRPESRGLFLRRVQGLTSYVEANDRNTYPEFKGLEVIRTTMGLEQRRRYVVVRLNEVQKERKQAMMRAASRARSDDTQSSQVYRAYSRTASDFVFPTDMERPYPSKFRDVDDDGGDKAYTDARDKLMSDLQKRSKKVLIQKFIGNFSSKLAELIPRLKECPGSAIVYSQFRTVEGLGVLRLALLANGWAEMFPDGRRVGPPRAPSFMVYPSNESHEISQSAIDLFNQPANIHGHKIKVLLISQSGAEGLSLKCVREVHLLEPYWNDIRVQQVIGRAVRANSHAALPKRDRNVRAFLYIATLPKEVYAEETVLRQYDRGKSTDEFLAESAARKTKVIDEFLGMLRSSAMDCKNKVGQPLCYVRPAQLPPEPDLEKDAARPHVKQVVLVDGKKHVVTDGDLSTI